jgi:hypothetical protein
LHSWHLKVEAVINQTPLLTSRWPQSAHSRVRSTCRRPDESVTALFLSVESNPSCRGVIRTGGERLACLRGAPDHQKAAVPYFQANNRVFALQRQRWLVNTLRIENLTFSCLSSRAIAAGTPFEADLGPSPPNAAGVGRRSPPEPLGDRTWHYPEDCGAPTALRSGRFKVPPSVPDQHFALRLAAR